MNDFIKQLKFFIQVNSSRKYLENFLKELSEKLPDDIHLLDAGAGKCEYKKFFNHVKYESADFCQVSEKKYGEIDYICDLSSIPVENERFNVVICTQVLEHIPEPVNVLKEFNRILKTDGKLYLSAPLFYEEHEVPYDFYRYTQYGLKYLLEKTGFEIEKIEHLEGYFGVMSYQFNKIFQNMPVFIKSNIFLGVVLFPFLVLLKFFLKINSIILTWLDILYKYQVKGYCKNYFVIAHKK